MDRIGRISRIIPYIQLFNRCDWTALDRGMAELPSAVAIAVAHGNAERLWKLTPVQ